MEQILPGGRLFSVPDAVETQRRVSRAAVQVLLTGSTVHREGLATARTMAHTNVDVAEQVLGPAVACSHDAVDDRLDDLEDASHRLEDHFLTAMLSTSRLTTGYAETFDDSVERTLRPERADGSADSA